MTSTCVEGLTIGLTGDELRPANLNGDGNRSFQDVQTQLAPLSVAMSKPESDRSPVAFDIDIDQSTFAWLESS